MAQHPLEPLTAEDFRQTTALLRSAGHVKDGYRFTSIELKEPPKADVKAWRPGQPVRRTSFAVVLVLPLSVLYSHAPSAAVAAFAVIATPRRVSLSASEKELPKRLATVSPAGLVVSSAVAARVGVPLATGASPTAVTVMLTVSESLSGVPPESVLTMVRVSLPL